MRDAYWGKWQLVLELRCNLCYQLRSIDKIAEDAENQQFERFSGPSWHDIMDPHTPRNCDFYLSVCDASTKILSIW